MSADDDDGAFELSMELLQRVSAISAILGTSFEDYDEFWISWNQGKVAFRVDGRADIFHPVHPTTQHAIIGFCVKNRMDCYIWNEAGKIEWSYNPDDPDEKI